jgi:predicted small metal-binding protein
MPAAASQSQDRNTVRKDHAVSKSQTAEAKYIACAAIIPDCPFTASAATEEELMQKVAAHAAHDHGVTQVTPELAAKVKAAIQTR